MHCYFLLDILNESLLSLVEKNLQCIFFHLMYILYPYFFLSFLGALQKGYFIFPIKYIRVWFPFFSSLRISNSVYLFSAKRSFTLCVAVNGKCIGFYLLSFFFFFSFSYLFYVSSKNNALIFYDPTKSHSFKFIFSQFFFPFIYLTNIDFLSFAFLHSFSFFLSFASFFFFNSFIGCLSLKLPKNRIRKKKTFSHSFSSFYPCAARYRAWLKLAHVYKVLLYTLRNKNTNRMYVYLYDKVINKKKTIQISNLKYCARMWLFAPSSFIILVIILLL